MKKKMKITIIATVIIVIALTILCSINSGGKSAVTVYSAEGNILLIDESEISEYLKVGWYSEPMMYVYSLEQNTQLIKVSEFADYHKVGWYSQPVIKIYDLEGKEYIICKSEKDTYLSNGFYETKPEVNYQDMVLLARVIYAEATENPSLRLQDRRYVGAVVMNRVAHYKFPNTLSGVIYARKQYACVGGFKFNKYPPKECLDIAKQLLLGERFGVPSNVVFQAQFPQGVGIWQQVGVHYYCYI